MFRQRIIAVVASIVFLFLGLPAIAQTAALSPQSPTSKANDKLPIDEVIRRFGENESHQRDARRDYYFQQKVVIQTLGIGDIITGEFQRISDVVFDDSSKRVEKVTYFPEPTLTEVTVTPEDLADLSGVQPFALTTEELPKYKIHFVGQEKIDELNTFVFDVSPKSLPNPKKSSERFLQGRIWVDDQDLVIVKVSGKGVPEGEQRFPHFETYRENIDGKYWFPTYTYADEILDFKKGPSVHIHMVINYKDYKKFGGSIELLDDDGSKAKPKKP